MIPMREQVRLFSGVAAFVALPGLLIAGCAGPGTAGGGVRLLGAGAEPRIIRDATATYAIPIWASPPGFGPGVYRCSYRDPRAPDVPTLVEVVIDGRWMPLAADLWERRVGSKAQLRSWGRIEYTEYGMGGAVARTASDCAFVSTLDLAAPRIPDSGATYVDPAVDPGASGLKPGVYVCTLALGTWPASYEFREVVLDARWKLGGMMWKMQVPGNADGATAEFYSYGSSISYQWRNGNGAAYRTGQCKFVSTLEAARPR
ncbi:MAG: hypothetical protein ACK4GG_12520 [Sphingomonas sp.]